MNAEEVRLYVLEKEGVTESFPFGENTIVFKCAGKIFLLMALDAIPLSFNVKCDPDKAVELREEYPENILPGFHMNKKHWNTILPKGLKQELIKEMIDNSYQLVTKKKKRGI